MSTIGFPEDYEVLSVRLPGELSAKLNETAASLGEDPNDIILESIRFYLWELGFQKLREELRPLAEKAGITCDEDVFGMVS